MLFQKMMVPNFSKSAHVRNMKIPNFDQVMWLRILNNEKSIFLFHTTLQQNVNKPMSKGQHGAQNDGFQFLDKCLYPA
jgi:hypothetical protein